MDISDDNIKGKKEEKEFQKLSDVKNLGYDHQLNVHRGNVVKSIRLKFFNDDEDEKIYTNQDLDSFDLTEKIDRDDRSKKEYFIDFLQNYNSLFYTFMKKSVINPQPLRVILFFQNINLFCLMNCMFFFDDAIEFRSLPENVYNFPITITNEYIKFILSFLISNYLTLMLKLLVRPRSSLIEEFNKLLWSIDITVITSGR